MPYLLKRRVDKETGTPDRLLGNRRWNFSVFVDVLLLLLLLIIMMMGVYSGLCLLLLSLLLLRFLFLLASDSGSRGLWVR